MSVDRTLVWYPKNSTTVDTGAGIDIRALETSNGGTNDATQTATATHTQDNVDRWWDPATAGNTDATNPNTTLLKRGWAIPLSQMTPADDTNCDVSIPAQTVTDSIDVAVGWSGGTITTNPTITFKASLWVYDPATDTGTLIAAGTSAATAWNNLTENGTFKTVTVSITVGDTTFPTGSILLLQLGLNTGTLPNPITGTVTYTFTLRVDDANTKVTLATKLAQTCTSSTSLTGDGVSTNGGLALTESRDLVGVGVNTSNMGVTETRDLVGVGLTTNNESVGFSRDLTGVGTVTRQFGVTETGNLTGVGTITRDGGALSIASDLVGVGVPSSTKAVTAEKTFDLVGEGTITEVHPVSAFRTFDLVGVGELVDSTITIPIDEIPDPVCPSDWSPNDGLKAIAGVVVFHEPPNQGDPVPGATVTLIRDSDGLLITTTLTAGDGSYSFPRDSNDPNTYHVEVNYENAGVKQQGLSEGGCAPQ